MTVLVTGGAGYIGSHMVLALLDAGEAPVVVDDLSAGIRSAVPEGVPFHEGDVGDEALISRILAEHRVKAIIHFAGSIIVRDSVSDPLGYYLNNTVKSRSLIACAVAAGVPHFIFSSTAAVYGSALDNPVHEGIRPAPITPYGSSKLMTETMLQDTSAAHGMGYVALRYFNVAGADPAGRAGQSTPQAIHLIKIASAAALEGRPVEIYGTDYPTPDGTCIRDYIHVSDLVGAHLLALDHLRRGGDNLVLNCGYGHGYSVRDVLAAVQRVAGVDLAVIEGERRVGDPPALVADATRLRHAFGWTPRFDDLDVIVRHALDWERLLEARRRD